MLGSALNNWCSTAESADLPPRATAFEAYESVSAIGLSIGPTELAQSFYYHNSYHLSSAIALHIVLKPGP